LRPNSSVILGVHSRTPRPAAPLSEKPCVSANYTITNPEGYKAYLPAVRSTLRSHGAEVVVADSESEVKEGSPGHVTVVLRFESKEAARAWYESGEYQEIMHHRTDNADGVLVVCDGFVMPN
jgi:uncharacterized protein (DUF1330 family)